MDATNAWNATILLMADPGGPFSEQARGTELPPDLLMPDPANQSAVEQAIATAANAGLGQAAGGEQRQAARRQLQVGAPDYGDYRLTTKDFYPSDGVQESRSTSVGAYPGSPLFAASAPKATMTLFAARGQALYEKQHKLDEATQKLMTGDGLDKAPPQYQRGFDQMYDQSWNTALAEETAYYGNERDAIREMSKPGSRANQRLMRMNRDYNTIVGERKYALEKAAAVVAGAREGSVVTDPKTLELAQKVEQGMLGINPAGVQTMAHMVPEFENRLSVYEYMNKRGLDGILKEAYAELDTLPELYRAPGGGLFAVQEKIKTAEKAKAEVKKHLKAYYPDDMVGDKTIDEIVESIAPEDKLVEWRQYSTHAPSSSSSADASKKPGTISFVASTAPMNTTEGTAFVPGEEGRVMSQYVPTIDVGEVTGGKTLPLAPRLLRDDDGKEHEVRIERFVKQDDGWHVTGRKVKSTAVTKEGVTRKEGDPLDDEPVSTESETYEVKLGDPFDFRVGNNMGKLRTYLGADFDLQRIWQEQQGGTAPAQPAAGQPPMDGAKKAPDGKWYVQKEGKWFRVD